jgi:hypothetical protein
MRLLAAATAAAAIALFLSPTPARADDGPLFPIEWTREWDRLPIHDLEPRLARALPRLSLLARDWGGTEALVGHLSLSDQARMSRSSRMIITRVRLFDQGAFAPFAHFGVGQFRIDAERVPGLPRDIEAAGQVGGGLEWTATRKVGLALEADYTVMYRPQHEPQMICAPQVAALQLAARGVF